MGLSMGDRLKIGFKYGDGFWSTVVWVELKVWLVKDKPNLVAVEQMSSAAKSLASESEMLKQRVEIFQV